MAKFVGATTPTFGAKPLVFAATRSVSADTTIVANDVITVTAACNLTTPASPSNGDSFTIIDRVTSSHAVLLRNSNKIRALAEDMTLDVLGATITFKYLNSTDGWWPSL